jgi:transcription elongation factor SPT6
VLAESYVSTAQGLAASDEDVIRTARFIFASELGKDPRLKKWAREQFKMKAQITVKPTEKGVNHIDEQHPYAVSSRAHREEIG